MPSLTTPIQHSMGSPSHSNETRKRNTRHPSWKTGSKTVIFSDDVLVYIKNPTDSTKKLLELINEFSKVAGYKINIQKSVAFLYVNNKLSEGKVRK